MNSAIRLVLVDDHPLILTGLKQLLAALPGFHVVATSGTTEEAWGAVGQHDPDIVVLDLKLANDEDGLSLLRRLGPDRRPAVVVLTASEDEQLLLDAVSLGARGVVLKATAPRVIEQCLRVVYNGGEWMMVNGIDLSQRLARREAIESELSRLLTSRELEVLRLAATGLDNQQIADRLDIGVGTVKIHLHHVYDKLGVGGRTGLHRFLVDRRY